MSCRRRLHESWMNRVNVAIKKLAKGIRKLFNELSIVASDQRPHASSLKLVPMQAHSQLFSVAMNIKLKSLLHNLESKGT